MKTKASTQVNWDKIDAVLGGPMSEGVPEGGITVQMLKERYSCSDSMARNHLRKLVETGGYEIIKCRGRKYGILSVAVPT